MRKRVPKKKQELELSVSICIEEQLPNDREIQNIAEILCLNVPMAMKLAFDGLKDSKYKTRETGIEDVGGFETVELSVMLCNDEFISNGDWDRENDIEMLELASFGVAMSNDAEKTKTMADVIGVSNDEDGVADAIYRYAF
ncbi:endoribonuclease YBEY, chloroplastic-like [Eutrema salsugineum]|uniref:endoribonuclease YBEY, chloroplastic-like n=1 Tax=Eutrema salsugineum TaxID=72664 RepID=UPI000CECF118|nr:endoribonuclease YBEY, chloroplastic-like [Eutrema salsugineum]